MVEFMNHRNSSLDMLRVVSMWMVIVLHSLGHGGVLNDQNNIEYYVVWLMESFSYVAVNCFILLSGYFLAGAKFKSKRIVNVIIQTFTYSIMCLVIETFFLKGKISFTNLFKSLEPIGTKAYWFMTNYIIMLLLSPLLNQIVENIDTLKAKKV